MSKPRPTAVIEKDHKGEWYVKITLPDSTRITAYADPKNRITYSNPQRVSKHLKKTIVPRLMAEARVKNLTGQ